jgi:adenosine deaminase
MTLSSSCRCRVGDPLEARCAVMVESRDMSAFDDADLGENQRCGHLGFGYGDVMADLAAWTVSGDGATRPRSAGRDLRALPKAELHLHLIGAMRPATLAEFAAEAGVAAPDPRAFTTFAGFEAIYRPASQLVLARLDFLLRLVREIVEDAAASGACWVQPHFDPHPFVALGSPDEVMELVLAEGRAAGARHGVGFGLTIGAVRHKGPEPAEALARFAARYAGNGVHAFGLAGDENAFSAEPFARAFAIAREAGLVAAPHAGELSGPESVWAAVDALGASRIAHGVRAVEDPRLLDRLVARGVSLDVCPSSNIALGVVPDIARHPLPGLLAAGVRCSLGADDPLMFGASLLDEYELARDALNLTDDQLAGLARTSIETSGAPAELIASALAGVDAWLASAPAEAEPA